MPEGDTVWRTARHLHEALAGRVLVTSDVRVPAYATLDLTGQVVDEVVSRGKHLLTRIGALSVHTHLKMEGAWHVYRPASRWRRPAHTARIVLANAEWQAVGFSLGLVEVVPRAEEGLDWLGPDLLGPDWDADEAVRRLASAPRRPVFLALHDQRNLAGLGNEYVNELCFVSGLLPTRAAGDVDLPTVVDRARRMIVTNRDRVERTFTGDTRPGQERWVFSRERHPCRRCGTPLRHGTLGDTPVRERNTFWCPYCQT